MRRWLFVAALLCGAGTSRADYVVRHVTWTGGAAVSRGTGRVLGSSIGQCLAGNVQNASTRGVLGFWALVGSIGAGPGGTVPAGTEFLLGRSAPNPFRQTTVVHYELPAAASVQLLVYDAGGRIVRRLLDAEVDAGPHDLLWDGRDDAGRLVPAGLYLYRLDTPGFSETRKLIRVP